MRLLCLGVVVLGACGPSTGDGPDAGADGAALEVRLSASELRWADGVTAPAVVSVVRIAPDGTEADVTATATLTVEPGGLAALTDASLTASGGSAGRGRVVARAGGLGDDAPFEVFVTRTVPGTAADGAAALFEGATLDPSAALAVVYPPAAALVPPNLGSMDVHWTDPAGKDTYEVALDGGYVSLRTYVAGLGASTWHTLAAEFWSLLSTGAAGVDLTVRVRGLVAAAPATFVEGTTALRIAAEDVRGGVYYWNTTQTAIMRFDMEAPEVPVERFYPPVGQGGCVGCHAVSRDGSVVAFRGEGGNVNYGNAVAVEGLGARLTANTYQWNFAAIHPNNRDLFTTAEDGLRRIDLETGAMTSLHSATRIAHPDVAPGGALIVATEFATGIEIATTESRIVVFDYDAVSGLASAPRVLVEPAGAAIAYYPSFSPDGAWVLFNQATGGSSNDNPNAELWVTRADGTGTPVRLAAAEVPGRHDSWPKWTPFVSSEPTAIGGSETVLWLTVASRRPFGVRSGPTQAPQLWMAPFYPDRVGTDAVVASPAVWLPFQVLAEGNHIAQWTETIVSIE